MRMVDNSFRVHVVPNYTTATSYEIAVVQFFL